MGINLGALKVMPVIGDRREEIDRHVCLARSPDLRL
jgi:hypothetical protein